MAYLWFGFIHIWSISLLQTFCNLLYYWYSGLQRTSKSKTVTEHAHTWFGPKLVQLHMLISAFRFAEFASSLQIAVQLSVHTVLNHTPFPLPHPQLLAPPLTISWLLLLEYYATYLKFPLKTPALQMRTCRGMSLLINPSANILMLCSEARSRCTDSTLAPGCRDNYTTHFSGWPVHIF